MTYHLGSNNNPLNLRYVKGEPWALRAGLRGFAKYADTPHGIAGAYHQLLLDWSRGLKTLTQLINSWAPGNENDTAAYIKAVCEIAGFTAEEALLLEEQTVA